MENVICKKCNASIQPGGKFCVYCGEEVKNEQCEDSNEEGSKGKSKYCSSCGAIMDENCNVCTQCGCSTDTINYESNTNSYESKSNTYQNNTNSYESKSYTEQSNSNSYGSNYNNFSNTQRCPDEKNNVVAALLAIFLGGLGIHKFYLGNKNMGILYILITVFGFILAFIPNVILGVVVLFEGILYLLEDNQSFNEKYNKNFRS